nr:hypothetical protein [uncultured Cohaesibacter sp.]
MKTIYLHIGTHKTGTTSLQNFLFSNREALKKSGWDYPDLGILDGAHHKLVRELIHKGKNSIFSPLSPKMKLGDLPLWNDLKNYIENSDTENHIFSGEGFWWVQTPQAIADFLKDYNIKIVIYLRRQDLYLESFYQQMVKDGPARQPKPIDAWVEYVTRKFNYHDYFKVIQKWEKSFGKENIIVAEFNRAIRFGLEKHFLNLVGIDKLNQFDFTTPEKTWVQRQKTSLDARCIEFLRLSNSVKMRPKQHLKILNSMMDISDNLKEEKNFEKYIMPLSMRRDILDRVEKSNEKLRLQYFSSEGKIFPDISEKDVSANLSVNEIVPRFIKAQMQPQKTN